MLKKRQSRNNTHQSKIFCTFIIEERPSRLPTLGDIKKSLGNSNSFKILEFELVKEGE
jgi:hypothetical protein